MKNHLGSIAAAGFLAIACHASAEIWPTGITEKAPIYDPNENADPLTGLKPNWTNTFSTKQPKYGMWQNQEHAIVQTGANRFLLILMEFNRAYYQLPDPSFADAYNFVEFGGDFPATPSAPVSELGYWRGATMESHPWVWAPFVIKEGSTYYLFFTAIFNGKLSPFLATSTTGDAAPSAWVPFDPNPGTPEQDPIFLPGADSAGFRDFHVLKVGSQFYMYYIAQVTDTGGSGQEMTEVRLRESSSLTSWPDIGEHAEPAFSRVNVGITHPSRYIVDYENPEVVIGDDGKFYLFISRHGQLPVDYLTNPDWVQIPLSTEVYRSDDGITFDVADQGPNLRTPAGEEINAAEIMKVGSRWFATHAAISNNIANWEFDCCPSGTGTPTDHSPLLQKLVSYGDRPDNGIHIIEFAFTDVSAVSAGWLTY